MNGDVFERLDDEHIRHGRASFHLAATFGKPEVDVAEVRALLREMVDGLVVHMADEEDHLFPWLRECLPERVDDVDMLVRQHTHLALLVAEFEIGLRRLDDRPLLDRIDIAKHFVKTMEAHSWLERELVTEARKRARG